MDRLRRYLHLARDADPLASWSERAGKLLWQFLLFVVGPSTLSGLGLAVLAYLTTYSVLYTAVFGLAAFALTQLGLSFRAIRRADNVTSRQLEATNREEGDGAEGSNELPYALPRPLPPDVKSRGHLSGLSFRTVDFLGPEQAMTETSIQGKVFYKCTIHGPAIAVLYGTRFTGNNTFFNEPLSDHPDSMLYELGLDRTQRWFAGTVGFRECVFRDCTFVDVGFLGDEPRIRRLKDHILNGGDIEI